MPSPFPGMNPYLENPEFWTEVHHLLISVLAETLNPQLLPKYRASVEKRVYQTTEDGAVLVGIPDVTIGQFKQTGNTAVASVPTATPLTVTIPIPFEVKEGYLEIREIATKEVITVIEVLSPANKRSGKGLDAYLSKREDVLTSLTNLVEIDLLRMGDAMPCHGNIPAYNYRILTSRSQLRPKADLYGFNLRDFIPCFSLPLRNQELEPTIDLHSLLDIVYDRAGYEFAIDYTKNSIPPLSEEERSWSDSLLISNGYRVDLVS
jgi:Protein of unknown function (DUF4058)